MSWWQYIPGVNSIGEAVQGNFGQAGKDLLWNPALSDAGSAIKNAYEKPFDEKRKGYDAIIAQSQQLKAERQARKDKTYAQAEEQYRPAREALAAVYGDPKSWKL